MTSVSKIEVGDVVRIEGEGRTLWLVSVVRGDDIKVFRRDTVSTKTRWIKKSLVEFFDSDEWGG